jgi:hypothetical protein
MTGREKFQTHPARGGKLPPLGLQVSFFPPTGKDYPRRPVARPLNTGANHPATGSRLKPCNRGGIFHTGNLSVLFCFFVSLFHQLQSQFQRPQKSIVSHKKNAIVTMTNQSKIES